MSPIGNHTRTGRAEPRGLNEPAEEISPVAKPIHATPHWLLSLTGIVAFVLCIVAFVLCIVAFVLWGINGSSTLFDMTVALCT